MATTVLTDVCFFVAEFDFTGEMNEVSLTQTVEIPDATTFQSGGTRQYTPGLKGVSGIHHGWINNEVGPPSFFGGDGTAWGLVGTQEAGNHTLLPEGGTTEGEVAYFFMSTLTKFSEAGSIGDLYGFDIEFNPRGDLIRGALMNDAITLQTGSFTGAKVQIGAQTAGTDILYARIHVVEFTGTTLDVVVRSDADASAGGETTRLSFTQATDVTSENLTFIAGTTDEYWDVDFTFVGTSFRAIVVVGIQ